MTGYRAPQEQQWAADQNRLFQRVSVLERQLARVVAGAMPATSATHPSNPATGMRIYETDTGLEAYWSGTAWVYPPQLIAKSVLTGSASSIPLSVPSGPAFSVLRVAWTARSDNAGFATYMCLRLNGDSGNNYLWQINQVNIASTAGSGNSGALTSLIQIGTMAGGTATSGYLGSGEFTIPNAAGNTYKAPEGHSTSTNSTTNSYSGTYGGLWLNTSAVTSITLLAGAGNLVAGSSAYLYGMT